MKTQKAFTLIELLLVISIIALLSSVVLSAVGESRNKARLATIKQDIVSLRNEGEIHYSTYKKYSDQSIFWGADCPTNINQQFGFLGSQKGIEIIKNMKQMGNTNQAKCYINPDSWVVVLGTSDINLAKTKITSVAYAATPDSALCFDSSKNIVPQPGMFENSADFITYDLVNINSSVYTCNQ